MCLGFVCVCVCILGCCFCLCVYIRCVSWQSVPYSWQAFGVLLLSFRCGEKGYQSRKLDQHIHTHTHPAACAHATIIYYSLIVYNGEPFSPHIATWFVPISCLSDLYFDFGWIDHLRVVRTRLTALLYRMGVFFPLSISRTMYIVYCETHSMKEFFFLPALKLDYVWMRMALTIDRANVCICRILFPYILFSSLFSYRHRIHSSAHRKVIEHTLTLFLTFRFLFAHCIMY